MNVMQTSTAPGETLLDFRQAGPPDFALPRIAQVSNHEVECAMRVLAERVPIAWIEIGFVTEAVEWFLMSLFVRAWARFSSVAVGQGYSLFLRSPRANILPGSPSGLLYFPLKEKRLANAEMRPYKYRCLTNFAPSGAIMARSLCVGLVRRLRGKAALMCWSAAALWLFAGMVGASAAHIDIVALGASNTAGYGVGSSSAYPAQLEALLRAKGYDVTVANAGVSGENSAQILNRVDTAVPAGTKVVILQILSFNDTRDGLNDAQHEANIKAAAARIRARGAKVILAGLPVIAGILAANHQYDGIHLTEQGHALLAARLLPQVIGAIGKAR